MTPHKPRSLRNPLLLLTGGIALIVMMFGGLLLLSYLRWERASDAKLAELAAQGIPTTLEERNRRYHEHGFDPADNASRAYDQAFALYPRGWNDRISESVFEYNKTLELVDLETVAELTEILSKNETAIALLKEASAYPYLRRNLDLTEGIELALPHLWQLEASVRLLAAEAIVAGQSGDALTAGEALTAIFRIASHLSAEPISSSSRAAIRCESVGLIALRRVMSDTKFDIQTIDVLAQTLRRLQAERVAISDVISSEFAFGLSIYELLGTGSLLSAVEQINHWEFSRSGSLLIPYRLTSLLAQDKFNFIDRLPDRLSYAELPYSERVKAGIPSAKFPVKLLDAEWIQTELLLSHFDSLLEAEIRSATYVRAALTALAAERFRLTTGDFPQRLEDLVPDYLQALPVDPYSADGGFEWLREDGFISVRSEGRTENGISPIEFRLRVR